MRLLSYIAYEPRWEITVFFLLKCIYVEYGCLSGRVQDKPNTVYLVKYTFYSIIQYDIHLFRYEPPHQKTNDLHRRKQRRRSA